LAPSIVTVVAMLASFYFLAKALETIPLGTAYAVWTGIGAVGTAALGIILFGEPRHLARLLCILLVVVGIVGLKITAAE
jgi:quaternary ammonium compound-resistance protein SugE